MSTLSVYFCLICAVKFPNINCLLLSHVSGIVVRPMSHNKIIRCESDKGEYLDARVRVLSRLYSMHFFQFLVWEKAAFSG